MLTCVYHPIDSPRVVDEDEAQKLIASGFWFDCPKKAKDFRAEVERDVKAKAEKPVTKSKPTLKG